MTESVDWGHVTVAKGFGIGPGVGTGKIATPPGTGSISLSAFHGSPLIAKEPAKFSFKGEPEYPTWEVSEYLDRHETKVIVRVTRDTAFTRTFRHKDDAYHYIMSGEIHREIAGYRDQTWTITWSPARKLWLVGNPADPISQMQFVYKSEALTYLGEKLERTGPSVTQDKMIEQPKTNYGNW